jgi:hypothetical protein
MDRFTVTDEIITVLEKSGVSQDALQHIWDRLLDGFAHDSEQELAGLYGMLRPSDPNFVFIRDGKVSSPKEPGVVAYRRV